MTVDILHENNSLRLFGQTIYTEMNPNDYIESVAYGFYEG